MVCQVRLCPEHAQQLNFRKNQEALRAQQKAARRQKHRQSGSRDASQGNFEELDANPERGHKRRREDAEPDWSGRMSAQGEPAELEGPGEEEGDAAVGSSEEINVWKGKQPQLEANKEEEFDDYFSGMFP